MFSNRGEYSLKEINGSGYFHIILLIASTLIMFLLIIFEYYVSGLIWICMMTILIHLEYRYRCICWTILNKKKK